MYNRKNIIVETKKRDKTVYLQIKKI